MIIFRCLKETKYHSPTLRHVITMSIILVYYSLIKHYNANNIHQHRLVLY